MLQLLIQFTDPVAQKMEAVNNIKVRVT